MTTWHSCSTRSPEPMIGACEKTKMRHPSSAGWSVIVFSNLHARREVFYRRVFYRQGGTSGRPRLAVRAASHASAPTEESGSEGEAQGWGTGHG